MSVLAGSQNRTSIPFSICELEGGRHRRSNTVRTANDKADLTEPKMLRSLRFALAILLARRLHVPPALLHSKSPVWLSGFPNISGQYILALTYWFAALITGELFSFPGGVRDFARPHWLALASVWARERAWTGGLCLWGLYCASVALSMGSRAHPFMLVRPLVPALVMP